MLWYLLRHSTPATIQNKMLQQASSGVKSSSYFDVGAFDSSLYGIYNAWNIYKWKSVLCDKTCVLYYIHEALFHIHAHTMHKDKYSFIVSYLFWSCHAVTEKHLLKSWQWKIMSRHVHRQHCAEKLICWDKCIACLVSISSSTDTKLKKVSCKVPLGTTKRLGAPIWKSEKALALGRKWWAVLVEQKCNSNTAIYSNQLLQWSWLTVFIM